MTGSEGTPLTQTDEEIISETDDGTFYALQDKIDGPTSEGTVYLENNYACEDSWRDNGILIIRPNLVIDGKGHTIDAKQKTGIFDVKADNVTIRNITFINANNSYAHGGAIHWSYGVHGTVSGCNFVDCYSALCGGAVACEYNDESLVCDCTFMNCHSGGNGGAVDWYESNRGVVCDCTFIDCHSDEYGGAVEWHVSNMGVVCDCIFMNCHSYNGGGAVYWNMKSDNGNISRCIFVNNSADNHGTIGLSHEAYIVQDCIFINNTGKYVILNDWSQYDNIKISNNIFLNNNLTGSIIHFNYNGTYELDHNWFGNTESNYNTSLAGASTDNWLFLNATANPNNLPLLGTTDVIFSLYSYNSTSQKISEYSITSPMPIELKITSTNGKTKDTAKLGETIKFSPTDAGIVSITASVGDVNCTVYLIVQKSSKLTSNDVTATYGQNKYLTVTLKSADGIPISGAKIFLNIGAKTYTTDKNGQVKINVGKLAPKTYKVKVTFKGNGDYPASQTTAKVTINKAPAKIAGKKKTYKATQKVKKYTVTFKANGKAIIKAKLTLKIKGKTYKATTNKKGKATFKIKNLKKKGKYNGFIKFKGDKYYKKATKKVQIRVK